MNKVLIIGGSGCVGGEVIDWLLENQPECEIVCLSRGLSNITERPGVNWVRGDILDKGSLLDAMRGHGVTHVLHTAAMRTSDCKVDPVRATEVNVGGTVNVLEAAREYGGVERFVFLSTGAVYAVPEGGAFVDEKSETCGLNAYTASKMAAEAMVECYARSYGLRSTVIRPQVIYGPSRGRDGSTAGVSVAIREALAGNKFTIPFGGRMYFHYTGDVGRFVGRSLFLQKGDYEVYNLPGESLHVSEIAAALNRRAGRQLIDHTDVDYPFAEGLDDGKYKRDFGIDAVTSFEQVLDLLPG